MHGEVWDTIKVQEAWSHNQIQLPEVLFLLKGSGILCKRFLSFRILTPEDLHKSLLVFRKQVLQGPVKPLDWRFPIVPEVQSEVAVDFQLRQPVTPSSVAIQCGENRVFVEVQQDLFSNGHLIQPSGLSLGGCPVVGQYSNSRVLIFEYELQDCNSVLMVRNVKSYWFVLLHQ